MIAGFSFHLSSDSGASMRAHDSISRLRRSALALIKLAMLPAFVVVLSTSAEMALRQVRAEVVDPLANGPVAPDLFPDAPAKKPAQGTSLTLKQKPKHDVKPANFQTNSKQPAATEGVQLLPTPAAPSTAPPKDPCGAVASKPLNQLGINIAEPTGKLPIDLAAPCWAQINQASDYARCWPVANYNWEATCFYHNPLYFEEVNLERYGYQCGDRCCCCSCGRECCLQPIASAGHFYGSVLALPYCMAVDCPGDCVYTLGHYRPGNCNPRRCHWPPFDPVAAASAGGIWTGLIFAIP